MTRTGSWLATLTALALSTLACAGLGGGVSVPADRPDDFSVRYAWQEGSLPPPYHYSYEVTIAADGSGQVTFLPDYDFSDPPIWIETFALDAAQMDALYQQMLDAEVFSRSWAEADDIPVGGSSAVLDVTAAGNILTVPAFPASGSDQADQAKQAVYSAVPGDIWERLNAQRDQYVQEHEAP